MQLSRTSRRFPSPATQSRPHSPREIHCDGLQRSPLRGPPAPNRFSVTLNEPINTAHYRVALYSTGYGLILTPSFPRLWDRQEGDRQPQHQRSKRRPRKDLEPVLTAGTLPWMSPVPSPAAGGKAEAATRGERRPGTGGPLWGPQDGGDSAHL